MKAILSCCMIGFLSASFAGARGPRTGSQLWQFEATGPVYSAPAVSPSGHVYVSSADGKLHTLDREGRECWQFAADALSEPTVGPDGTIYVSAFIALHAQVVALRPDGRVKWVAVEPSFGGLTAAALARDGTIYVGSGEGALFALGSDGTVEWEFATTGAVAAPVIGAGGVVYFGTADGKVYAVQGSAPPTHHGWPMYRHDAQGTGNAGHHSPGHR